MGRITARQPSASSVKRAAIREIKAEKRRVTYAKRTANQKQRAVVRAQYRCFWTWPWGHVFARVTSGTGKRCVICDAQEYTYTSY